MRDLRLGLAVFLLACACGGEPPSSVEDGGSDATTASDGSAACSSDADCDDGIFCNGTEVCAADDPLAGADGCLAGVPPCAAGTSCDEGGDRCTAGCTTDADGDGQRAEACGGADCDDDDPNAFPGNTEICDVAGHDEDCDPRTFGFRDADGDGAPDATCCNTPTDGAPICGDDCDDMRPGTNPDNPDICNGRDDDCDGTIDEEVQVLLVEDADLDGYGSAAAGAATMLGCGPSVGWQVEAVDCDDADGARHPGATEQCDGVDDDCDGAIDERMGGCGCSAGASQSCSTDVGVCTLGTQSCTSGGVWGSCSGIEPTGETCNGADDDCDGTTDEGVGITCYPDGDGDGYAVTGATAFTACRDPNPARAVAPFLGCAMGSTGTAPTTAPPAPTADCNDASGTVTIGALCYRDADGDGFGAAGTAPTSTTCGGCPAGESLNDADCCDSDAASKPGGGFASTPNACGSWDRNCNGVVEEFMGSGYGSCTYDTESETCLMDGDGGYTGAVPACGVAATAFLGCSALCRPIVRSITQECS